MSSISFLSKNKINAVRLVIFLSAFLVIFLGEVGKSWATEYYVSPAGVETWPNCTTQNNPCQASNTSKSFLDAVAGDTVYFLNGTYAGLTYSDSTYDKAAWVPSSSGSSESPITFKALNNQEAHLVGLSTPSNVGCPMAVPVIGSYGHTNIVWDGFVISAVDELNNPVSGTVQFYNSSDYSVIRNSKIIGVAHSTGGACNYQGVRVEASDNCEISNNEIYGFIESSDNHNTSGIKTYNNTRLTIKNNFLHDNTANIYIKGAGNFNYDIYNNYITNGNIGFLYTFNSGDNAGHTIYNNIFSENYLTWSDDGGGGDNTYDLVVYNNTFYNSTENTSIYFHDNTAGHDEEFYNNILVGVSSTGVTTRPTESRLKKSDHNLYYPNLYMALSLYSSVREYTSLGAWQASNELSVASDTGCGSNQHPGCGSLNVDPLFVNTSGTYANLVDFALSSNSPAKGAGRSGVDMGADVSLVGIQSGSGDTTAPASPHGLTVL